MNLRAGRAALVVTLGLQLEVDKPLHAEEETHGAGGILRVHGEEDAYGIGGLDARLVAGDEIRHVRRAELLLPFRDDEEVDGELAAGSKGAVLDRLPTVAEVTGARQEGERLALGQLVRFGKLNRLLVGRPSVGGVLPRVVGDRPHLGRAVDQREEFRADHRAR